jgi:hypothetical protein
MALFATLMVLSVCFYFVGCGNNEIRLRQTGATLEGNVTYGKEKITDALIMAQNDSGSATAFVDDNGHFKLENVPLGEVNLGVNTEAGKGLAIGKLMAKTMGKGNKAGVKILEVPANFQDPTKSGIKTTIVRGTNEVEIKIPR